jgi:hypothetical protein
VNKPSRFSHCVLLLIASLAFGGGVLAVEQDVATRIKAAFIYHFCSYVEWPDSAFADDDSSLVIGVAGSAAMATELRSVFDNRNAQGRAVEVRELDANTSPRGVHLLYAVGSAAHRLSSTDDQALLVVTDSPDGLDAGGAINFIIENDRVRFDVALPRFAERRLEVSARLLTVAREVREGG